MNATEQELADFSSYAKSQLDTCGNSTLEELFDEWRLANPTPSDALAVEASLRDMEQGETGRPFDEFAAEFRQRNRIAGDQ